MRYFHVTSLLLIAMLMSLSAAAETELVDMCSADSIVQVPDQSAATAAMKDRLLKEMPAPELYEPHHGMDFTFLKNTTNPEAKPYTFMQDQTWGGIPLFIAGIIAKGEKAAFRQNYNNTNTRIRLVKYDFHSEIDNYTQFSGIALTVGLKLAGVEGRSSWPRLFASSMASYALMAGFVNGIKYTSSELRPDGSTKNSWPSGHTATAFVGATILHKEYGLTRSPWYSIAGYSLATATGVMRVLNNRHWISDVLSGAGIGILSTELAYGICDLFFKQKGLLRNDLSYFPDLSKSPSFFSISMGIGLGNKHLNLPAFTYGVTDTEGAQYEIEAAEPLHLKFRSATAVGVEGAWFFNPYVGIGARLRVKSTPINGWSQFATIEQKSMEEIAQDPDYQNSIKYFSLDIESDHITEFAADAGVYFSLPLSKRLAIGSKLLIGHSVMDDIEVKGTFLGDKLDYQGAGQFIPTDEVAYCDWEYINVHASNSMKFGSGLSITYSHKNQFSWRLFCDYDFAKKTYKASYAPFDYMKEFIPKLQEKFIETLGWDIVQTYTSSARKNLNQWVLGGALCVSF